MSNSLIHIRIENQELIESKREILQFQASLIKSLQQLKNYSALRNQELKLKSKLSRKLKETKAEINRLQQLLPKVKIPEFLKKDEFEFKEKIKEKKEIKSKTDLDYQLEEIQRKLNELQK